MLFLLLKRIADSSETAINHLRSQFEGYKISSTQGEDLEEVITLIKSLHALLQGASTSDRNYVPDDFPKTVLQVLQTTSVKKFNDIFYDKMEYCRRRADKAGGATQWPTISEIMTLATASYSRLKSEWNVSGKRALMTDTQTGTARSDWKFWNCEKDCGACTPKDCKAKPFDEERVARNRDAFYKAKRNRQHRQGGNGGSKPQKKMIDGKPMILNKKGAYVLDQAKLHKQKAKADLKSKEADLQKQKDDLVKQFDTLKSNLAQTNSSTKRYQQSSGDATDSISCLEKVRAAVVGL